MLLPALHCAATACTVPEIIYKVASTTVLSAWTLGPFRHAPLPAFSALERFETRVKRDEHTPTSNYIATRHGHINGFYAATWWPPCVPSTHLLDSAINPLAIRQLINSIRAPSPSSPWPVTSHVPSSGSS